MSAICCSLNFGRFMATSPSGPEKPIREFARNEWSNFRGAGQCAPNVLSMR